MDKTHSVEGGSEQKVSLRRCALVCVGRDEILTCDFELQDEVSDQWEQSVIRE
jgi:hypothetical protein